MKIVPKIVNHKPGLVLQSTESNQLVNSFDFRRNVISSAQQQIFHVLQTQLLSTYVQIVRFLARILQDESSLSVLVTPHGASVKVSHRVGSFK